ncbi:arginine/serine-rich coiled-coil protein 2-like isoform X2 [Cylas formicarius]|nr:arginine/serine-rich coiled-coil protein 2-like isoform X2 [Cylas formicarius]
MDMSEDSDEEKCSTPPPRKPEDKSLSGIGRQTSSSSSSSNDRHSGSPRSDRKYNRDSRDDRRSSKDDNRHSRDAMGRRDGRGRDKEDKNDKFKDDRRDRKSDRDRYGRDRRDRDRRRSRSRERRRSRSPRRSSSKERGEYSSRSGYGKKFDKVGARMDRLDKLGIEIKTSNSPWDYNSTFDSSGNSVSASGDRFFMPGITGRFREQIEKRKLLWQKAKEPESTTSNAANVAKLSGAGGSKSTKVYESTNFADDKTSSKFKRLMGIRDSGGASAPGKGTDVLKKQDEMFSVMEAQYEVARTATHTMRGVGLGFGSFQR